MPFTVLQCLVCRFNGQVEVGGGLFGRPLLGAHSAEELSNGKTATLECKLLSPGVRARYKIRIVQIGPQCSCKFGNRVRVLVIHRHDGELISLTNAVRKIFDDVEDAPRRLSVPSASHSLAEDVYQEPVPGGQFELEASPR